MQSQKFGPKIAFVLGTIGALAYWPAGCTQQLPPGGSAASESAPSALVKSETTPKTFLPHPAFAYAKTGSDQATIADIAERAAPSVVNVSSSRVMKARQGMGLPFNDPLFRHFFGPGARPGPGPEEREQQGLGSGVIVSADGIVLTNNHVVEDASTITVTLADEREFEAEVLGADAKSDLAVLKLKGDVSGLRPLKFGDSSRLRLGDVVLAIGNPFGVGQTITMGIVSAKGRANVGIVDYEDFIQTDAAINPGNSGGALVDMEGNLVGINTAILSRSGGNQGIGFAIPSNMAEPIMRSLVDHGKVERGWLGVGIQDVDADLAKAMQLPNTDGVLVTEVQKGSPAEKAGLEQGDVILKLEGKKMDSTGRLRNAVAAAGSQHSVKLDILRQGKSRQVTVQLGELPEAEAALKSEGAKGSDVLDGLTIESLNAATRNKYGVPADVKEGVVVSGIEPGSKAAKAGLRPGDVIVEMNRKPVTNVGRFKQLYGTTKGSLLLLVNRQGHNRFVVLK